MPEEFRREVFVMNDIITNLRLATELILPWLQLAAIALIAREIRRKDK